MSLKTKPKPSIINPLPTPKPTKPKTSKPTKPKK